MTSGKSSVKSCLNINLGPGSNIYEEFSYPAGEIQIRIRPESIELFEDLDEARVIARITSPADIVRLALLKSAVDGTFGGPCGLVLPYLPYARADRRFLDGDCYGALVFSELLDSMGFQSVACLDSHSRKSTDFITGIVNVSPLPFIHRTVTHLASIYATTRIRIILPDEGALNRYCIPDSFGNNRDKIECRRFVCAKRRDPATGKLSGFEVPHLGDSGEPVLIVDDICDGGGTFLGIAGHIPEGIPLALYTTHGIYSRGLGDLSKRFSPIFTTDSFPGARSENVVEFPCTNLLLKATEGN